MAAKRVSFTIDGVTVEASEGQSVLEACDAAGIYIPRLCYHPDLKTTGTCRVCTCLINGKHSAACVTPAVHGMSIQSETPQLTDDRRTVIEMLFVEGDHPCLRGQRGLRTPGAGLPAGHGRAQPTLSMA